MRARCFFWRHLGDRRPGSSPLQRHRHVEQPQLLLARVAGMLQPDDAEAVEEAEGKAAPDGEQEQERKTRLANGDVSLKGQYWGWRNAAGDPEPSGVSRVAVSIPIWVDIATVKRVPMEAGTAEDRQLDRQVYMWFPEVLTENGTKKTATQATPIISTIRAIAKRDKETLMKIFVAGGVKI
eukprot:COSAG06_NODE_28058_length_581_cov_1.489627_1_plen_180_part_10